MPSQVMGEMLPAEADLIVALFEHQKYPAGLVLTPLLD